MWDGDNSSGLGVIRAELNIYDRDNVKENFVILENEKETIEQEMGEPLTWYDPPNASNCRLCGS